MKSLRYLLTLFFILTIVAVILVLKNQKSTFPPGLKNIAVGNPTEIDKIIIQTGAQKILLEKGNQDWRLNNAFEVKKSAIDLVLSMLQRLEIVAPLPRNYQNIAAKKLENSGKHVQIFKGNHIIRSFFIDFDTTEIHGTIFLKEGSKTPFFLKLKGYSLSDISLLFSLQIAFWRDNTLFTYQPSDILNIRIEYPVNPSGSFEINMQSPDQPELIKTGTGERINDCSNKSMLNYLNYFSDIKYQLIETDSLQVPDEKLLFAEIKITDVSNTLLQVKLYRITRNNNTPDMQQYDLNHCYGKINNEKEIIAIKYVDIDPILKELDDFLKK